MGLLTKLKSLLGLEDDRSQVRRTDSGVTIEREPESSPDAETESAVKGVDADAEESFDATDESGTDEAGTDEAGTDEAGTDEAGTDEDGAETGISTEDVTTAPAAESAESGTDDAAEPAEAVQPSPEAGQPAQTEETEPEPTPEAEAPDEVDEGGEPDEQAAEDDAAAPDESLGEGEPLDDIKGIGSAYAERLNDAGVADIAELARADAEQLAAETGVSEKRIATWIDRAKAR